MPEPEKLDSEPPETAMSDSMKSLDDSESVNINAAISPAFKEVTLELMATVGLMASIAEAQLPLESRRATKTSSSPAPVSSEVSNTNGIDSDAGESVSPPSTNVHIQKAPLVGTVYLSPKPGEDNFISEGEKVSKGDTICIIEAMKIFNEIESEISGTVKAINVNNESPVEFGQPIFEIIPD